MIGTWIPKFAVVIEFKLCSLGLEIIKNVARFLLEHVVLTLLASVIYPLVWRNVWIWFIVGSVLESRNAMLMSCNTQNAIGPPFEGHDSVTRRKLRCILSSSSTMCIWRDSLLQLIHCPNGVSGSMFVICCTNGSIDICHVTSLVTRNFLAQMPHKLLLVVRL